VADEVQFSGDLGDGSPPVESRGTAPVRVWGKKNLSFNEA